MLGLKKMLIKLPILLVKQTVSATITEIMQVRIGLVLEVE